MKIYCYCASFRIPFILISVFGNLSFKSEQYLARWISAYLIYSDHQRGLLIKFIRFVQMFFGVVFSYERTAKKRTRWPLT